MSEPRPHLRYTKRQKITAVIAAEMSSAAAAAEETGIPRRTIGYWMEDPEIASLRQKTREDLAEEAKVLQQIAAAEIRKRIGEFEGRDLVLLYGVVTDKAQLLSGQATTRAETRELSSRLTDHEKDALADAIDAFLRESADATA